MGVVYFAICQYVKWGGYFIAAATAWNERKRLTDYLKLSGLLTEGWKIVLVGVTDEMKKNFPKNVIGITRTSNQQELAALYSNASILLSLSAAETFGLTMAEAMACGTPVIVYDNTAQPEIVTAETGSIVKDGDVEALAQMIQSFIDSGFKEMHSADCRQRAVEYYDKDMCFEKYVELYDSLIG